MYGFRITIGEETKWPLILDDQSFIRHWDQDTIHVTQWSLHKFEKDKFWIDTPNFFLAVEGILFNRDEITQNLPQMDVSAWRGSFACILVNKATQEIEIYNDQIGSHMLFWYKNANSIYISSDIFDLAHVSGLNQPNPTYMETILKRGYANDDSTMIIGIQRICAGQVLRINQGKAQKETYYQFDNKPLHAFNDATLAETNRLFRQAVQRVVRKNEEYNLRQFYPLSGGLDSRMVQIIARQLTNEPITNFTYSQTGHYDHLFPHQIAKFLGNEWTFLPLDGGDYLTEIDAITRSTQALVNYNGPAEIYYCSTQFDWKDVGVVATGINGDNIFSVETDHEHEIERLYSLSFAGNGLGSPLVLQQHTETYSPFCDVDVLEYVLHIPLSERWNYHFYDKWILRYYPEVTQWDHKGENIGNRKIVVPICGRNIPLLDLPKRIVFNLIKRLHIHDFYLEKEGESMNPYDTWIQNNQALRESITNYYDENKDLLLPYPDIAKQAKQMMYKRAFYSQCAVLTILSAIRQFKESSRS